MKKPKGWRGDSRGHSIAAKKGWNSPKRPELSREYFEKEKARKIRRVSKLIREGKIIAKLDTTGDFKAYYYGKNYSNAVNQARNEARKEYNYPSSNLSEGMKKVGGRGYYAQLLKKEILRANIPNDLKTALTERMIR